MPRSSTAIHPSQASWGVIDRDLAEELGLADALFVHITRKEFPEPPVQFVASQEVTALWNRFGGYRQGKELLLSMAYFCLSFVEHRFGGRRQRRKNAAAALNIEEAVLKRLGGLTSRGGDLATARKVDANATGQPLTEQERQWLATTILRLIKQLGAYHASPGNPPVDRVAMADLPVLPPDN